ncbi:GFA family protein [Piscinibacter sp.]|uniref:GFA family protein n=1 Tax=Piscinibacter sp. TaxID=1903157 RepID=UPI002D0140FB|nr:GFA family protein [Albitalea sp.]HUG23372.1 GFA family protein [Albitalea sp.]
MNELVFDGGCLCGAVRYRAIGELLSSSVCHCRSCRRASGAPSVAWFVVRNTQFTVVSGQVSSFRSSPPALRSFCGQCGTPLTYQHDDNPGTVDITTATLDDPELVPPTHEIWLSHRISWAASDPEVEHCPRGSGEGRDIAD